MRGQVVGLGGGKWLGGVVRHRRGTGARGPRYVGGRPCDVQVSEGWGRGMRRCQEEQVSGWASGGGN